MRVPDTPSPVHAQTHIYTCVYTHVNTPSHAHDTMSFMGINNSVSQLRLQFVVLVHGGFLCTVRAAQEASAANADAEASKASLQRYEAGIAYICHEVRCFCAS